MSGVTFKQTAVNLREVIAGLFSPKYAEQNQTKWITNLLADDGLFTQDDGALVAPYDAWTGYLSGTLLVDTNRLEVTNGAANQGYGTQTVNVTIGTTYLVTFGFESDTSGSRVTIYDGVTTLVDVSAGTGSYVYEIRAVTSILTLNLGNSSSTSGHIRFYDNIQVRESMPEKVQNGTFDSDTGWTKGTGWSIGSDVATCDGEAFTTLVQEDIFELGKMYILTYTVTARTAGTIRIQAGATTGIFRNSVNTFTETLQCTDNTNLTFYSESFNGSIDNISVKEISVELPHNAEVQAVYSDGSRQTPEDAYNIFDNGMTKQVNFTDDAVLTTDIAIDYRNKL